MRKYGDVQAIAWQSAGAALALLHGGPQLAGYDYNALVKIFRQVLAVRDHTPSRKSHPSKIQTHRHPLQARSIHIAGGASSMQQSELVNKPESSAGHSSALMVCPMPDRHARVESREAGQQLRVAGSAMLAVGRLRRLVKAHVGADNDQPIEEGPSLLSSEPGLYSCHSHVKVLSFSWRNGARMAVTLLQGISACRRAQT